MSGEHFQIELKCTFTMMVSGPSKSGKTTLVSRIIEHANQLYTEPPNKIFYFFNQEQPTHKVLHDKVHEFHEGLPTMNFFREIYEKYGKNCTVVIDDQALRTTVETAELFSVGSSRNYVNIIFLTQNLFGRKKEARDISLNCNYVIVFKNPRDPRSMQTFFTQFAPGNAKVLLQIYQEATKEPHSYLFIDLHQETAEKNRLLSNIFAEDGSPAVIYR